MSQEPVEPSETVLLKFIELTWQDMHQSRMQNWTCITVVTVFHVGIFKIVEFLSDKNILFHNSQIYLFIFGALFSLIGFLITIRHQFVLYEHLNWVHTAHIKLKLEDIVKQGSEIDMTKKRYKKALFSVGILMSFFYLLLLFFDVLTIFLTPFK